MPQKNELGHEIPEKVIGKQISTSLASWKSNTYIRAVLKPTF